MLDVKLLPQEEPTNAQFAAPVYATKGFHEKFGKEAGAIALRTLLLIGERIANGGADYLQIAEFDNKRFWVIDDGPGACVTFLLPSEY